MFFRTTDLRNSSSSDLASSSLNFCISMLMRRASRQGIVVLEGTICCCHSSGCFLPDLLVIESSDEGSENGVKRCEFQRSEGWGCCRPVSRSDILHEICYSLVVGSRRLIHTLVKLGELNVSGNRNDFQRLGWESLTEQGSEVVNSGSSWAAWVGDKSLYF